MLLNAIKCYGSHSQPSIGKKIINICKDRMSKLFSQCLENKEHNFSLGRWLGHRLENTICPGDVIGRAFGVGGRTKCSARGKEMQTLVFFSLKTLHNAAPLPCCIFISLKDQP